jgi:hypothetical protein
MDRPAGLSGFHGDFESFFLHFENGNAVFLHEIDQCANFFKVHRLVVFV